MLDVLSRFFNNLLYYFRGWKKSFTLLVFLVPILYPSVSSAHEVYLLDPETVGQLEKLPPVPFFDIFYANLSSTLIWASLIILTIISVFLISISVTLENIFDGYLVKLKKFAPFVARITIGLSFIMSGYNAALFGPELPMTNLFGEFAFLAQAAFIVLGFAMLFGVFTRITGLIGLLLFAYGIYIHGTYMITYLNYLAEFIVLILIGGHKFHVTDEKPIWWKIPQILDYLANRYGEFAFLILRVGFGIGLIYSAVHAKILYNHIALAVVNNFNLSEVFGFAPDFLVFGAAIIEILLGIFFILGIEIRFNSIVITVFLTLSLLYFGEAVWPHIILIGIPIAFFCYGYDKYSIEGYFFKKGNREPIF
jgi:uncharacterized membrane protein YphA (DoxX/SURF4 family)